MRGEAVASCRSRNALVSSTTAAATWGVNSGNVLAAIVNSSGSFTSSQARKNLRSFERASSVAKTLSIVFCKASGVST